MIWSITRAPLQAGARYLQDNRKFLQQFAEPSSDDVIWSIVSSYALGHLLKTWTAQLNSPGKRQRIESKRSRFRVVPQGSEVFNDEIHNP